MINKLTMETEVIKERYDSAKARAEGAVQEYRRYYFKNHCMDANGLTDLPSKDCEALEEIIFRHCFPDFAELERPVDVELLKRIAGKNKGALTRLWHGAYNNIPSYQSRKRESRTDIQKGDILNCDLLRVYEQCPSKNRCKYRNVGPKAVSILFSYLMEMEIIPKTE